MITQFIPQKFWCAQSGNWFSNCFASNSIYAHLSLSLSPSLFSSPSLPLRWKSSTLRHASTFYIHFWLIKLKGGNLFFSPCSRKSCSKAVYEETLLPKCRLWRSLFTNDCLTSEFRAFSQRICEYLRVTGIWTITHSVCMLCCRKSEHGLWQWNQTRRVPLLWTPYHLTQGETCWGCHLYGKSGMRGSPCRALPWKWKTFFLVQILGGEKLLKFVDECRWNIIKQPERGLNCFGRVSDRFSDLFSRFQTVFRIALKVFRGQFRSAAMPPWQIWYARCVLQEQTS